METTFETEEKADLVQIGSTESAADQMAGVITDLESQIADLEAEMTSVEKSYNAEVLDHAETAKKVGITERMLLRMYELWAMDSGCNATDLNANDDEIELSAFIGAAYDRKSVADEYAARKDKAA